MHANNKAVFLALVIFGLLVIALLSQDGSLAALTLPFLAYLWIGVLQAPGEVKLSASRNIEMESMTACAPIDVRVSLINQSDGLANLFFEDAALANTSLIRGHLSQRLALPAGQSAALGYTIRAGRGVYEWNSLHIIASDPLGLFQVDLDLPAADRIVVQPELKKLHPIALRPRSTVHLAGSLPARLAGSGTDFWGVREYRPGDPLRRLNWRMTARLPDRLFSKEFEQNEIMEVNLILDASTPALNTGAAPNYGASPNSGASPISGEGAPPGYESLFEHSIQAALSLAEVILRGGNRVGLLVFGNRMIYLYPGYGKRQLNKISQGLARAAPNSELSLSGLRYLPAQLFPSRSMLLIISPLDEDDLEAFTRLSAYGYQILLVSPDPIDYAVRVNGLDQREALPVRMARLERRLQLERLLRLGIQVIDWQVSRSLDETIHTKFSPANRSRNFV